MKHFLTLQDVSFQDSGPGGHPHVRGAVRGGGSHPAGQHGRPSPLPRALLLQGQSPPEVHPKGQGGRADTEVRMLTQIFDNIYTVKLSNLKR